MLKITKAILTKWFHKNSKLRRKHKQKMFLKYYSKNFLCTECKQWCNRYHDEYPCYGEEPGGNECIDCFWSKRSQKANYYDRYYKMNLSDKERKKRIDYAAELNRWFGCSSIFDDIFKIMKAEEYYRKMLNSK